MTTDRIPYCHKIRYGITGAPILAEDEMDGSYAPGVGVRPSLIELVYSAARDGKPASVSASVTGSWTRFGEPADGQVTTHFANGPSGWPAWLAEEARLHDPAAAVPVAAPPTTEQTEARCAVCRRSGDGSHPAVCFPPAPADRAATFREAAELVAALDRRKIGIVADTIKDAWEEGRDECADLLRRLAVEAEPDDGPTWSDICPRCNRWYTTSEPGAHEKACQKQLTVEAEQAGGPSRGATEPQPEAQTGCPSDVAAAFASCPGYEMAGPSPCRCPCYGCKHHCGAHQPAVSSRPGTEQEANAGARIVAHVLATHTDLHCLNCTPPPHGDVWTPVTADELDDGGVCVQCGVDVLIPQAPQ
ncbi:hypothetical protein OG235_27825 [Streptomyces sp. NBC_00024]|uniref:hypothetical protein n=1 Tax=Streptomyces sp. NBC_00024 TaxID=2903612 RepID=UPI0032443E1F